VMINPVNIPAIRLMITLVLNLFRERTRRSLRPFLPPPEMIIPAPEQSQERRPRPAVRI